jgi:hypothetical protein
MPLRTPGSMRSGSIAADHRLGGADLDDAVSRGERGFVDCGLGIGDHLVVALHVIAGLVDELLEAGAAGAAPGELDDLVGEVHAPMTAAPEPVSCAEVGRSAKILEPRRQRSTGAASPDWRRG